MTVDNHNQRAEELQSLLESAARTEFYGNRLEPDTPYRELPYTDQDVLIDDPNSLLAAEAYRVNLSGGTTGSPKIIYKSSTYRDRNVDAIIDILYSWDDIWDSATVAILQPFGPWGIGHSYLDTFRKVGALSIPLGVSLSLETEVRVLRTMDANVLCATPSKADAMINEGFAQDLDYVILAGEKPTIGQLDRIRETLSARILQFYGSEEMNLIGYSCAERSIHLWSDKFIYEILGGESGELVLTNLYNHAQPLIKYRLGDRVRLVDCDCDRDDPALEVLGRSNTLVLRDGTNVSERQLGEAIADHASGIDDYQFVVRRTRDQDVLELLVDSDGADLDREELVGVISNASIDLNSSLQQENIQLRITSTNRASFYRTKRGKVPKLFDRR